MRRRVRSVAWRSNRLPVSARLTLPGITIQTRTSANSSGALSDPSGNKQIQPGEFWGVMGLTLNQSGYSWDFESALKDPAQTTGPPSFIDKGVGSCHDPINK